MSLSQMLTHLRPEKRKNDAPCIGICSRTRAWRQQFVDAHGAGNLVPRSARRVRIRVRCPMNLHFIRDVGCAYFVVALGPLALARSPMRARPAALAGAAFLVLHVMVHVWDFTAGREHAHGFLNDLPGVFLPAILTLWLACRASK